MKKWLEDKKISPFQLMPIALLPVVFIGMLIAEFICWMFLDFYSLNPFQYLFYTSILYYVMIFTPLTPPVYLRQFYDKKKNREKQEDIIMMYSNPCIIMLGTSVTGKKGLELTTFTYPNVIGWFYKRAKYHRCYFCPLGGGKCVTQNI